MKKAALTVKLLVCTNILQLLVIGLCFYLFSSKIEIIPWYSPLTSAILLHLIILFTAQIIMNVYIWFMWEKHTSFKLPMLICSINTVIILAMFFIGIASIAFFNILTIITALIELLLFIYLLRSTITILKAYK